MLWGRRAASWCHWRNAHALVIGWTVMALAGLAFRLLRTVPESDAGRLVWLAVDCLPPLATTGRGAAAQLYRVFNLLPQIHFAVARLLTPRVTGPRVGSVRHSRARRASDRSPTGGGARSRVRFRSSSGSAGRIDSGTSPAPSLLRSTSLSFLSKTATSLRRFSAVQRRRDFFMAVVQFAVRTRTSRPEIRRKWASSLGPTRTPQPKQRAVAATAMSFWGIIVPL